MQCEKKRRRRSLTVAHGSSEARTLGSDQQNRSNPERVPPAANPFRVYCAFGSEPRVVAVLQPWAKVSERLRRYFSNCITTICGCILDSSAFHDIEFALTSQIV